MKDSYIRFRCREEMKKQIKEHAASRNMSMSEFIAELIRNEIGPAAGGLHSLSSPAAKQDINSPAAEDKLTIKYILDNYSGKCDLIEPYHSSDGTFENCDYMGRIELLNPSTPVIKYKLMDEEEFQMIDDSADFEDWFGDKNAKILVCLV